MANLLVVGAKFDSYDSLSVAVKDFEKQNHVTLWKREARTISSMKKRVGRIVKEGEQDKLVYYTIKYTSIFGGREHKKRSSTGTRSSTTFRQDCPANIRVLLSKDQKFLEITSMNTEHSHVVSEELNNSLPSNRKLTEVEKNKVSNLLNLQVNKKLLQQQIHQETGKLVTLRDLSNVAAKSKEGTKSFEEIVDILKEKYKCCVSALHDSEQVLQGLFWQDQDMKRDFDNFPEMIFFDGTYKLLNINFTCYIFLVVDGNDCSEVVGIGILSSETKEAVQWLIQQFKAMNSHSSDKIRAIMTDKDFTERVVFKEEFPAAQLLICLFHALRIFNREITTEKMKISSDEVIVVKEFLNKMAYSTNEELYMEHYKKFSEIAPPLVKKYYDKNWHPIRMEWTYMNCISGNFGHSTNNKLENMNGKLKSVIQRYSSLPKFIDGFFALLNCLRQERNHKAACAVQRQLVTMFQPGSPEYLYSNYLLPHPSKHILKQLAKSKNSEITTQEPNGYVFKNSGLNFPVSPLACSCHFFKSMRLPCSHILSVKAKLGLDLFDPDLCDKRWTREYYTSCHRIYHPISICDNGTLQVEKILDAVPKSANGKFKRIYNLGAKLADVASLSSQEVFREQEAVLMKILGMWEQGKKVTVVCSDDLEKVVSVEKVVSDHNYNRNFSLITGDMQQHVMEDPEMQTWLLNEEDPCNSNISHVAEPDADDPEVPTSPFVDNPCNVYASHIALQDADDPEVPTFPFIQDPCNVYVSHIDVPEPVEEVCVETAIKIPIAIKRKGRAQGFGSTIIGMKKKKRNEVK